MSIRAISTLISSSSHPALSGKITGHDWKEFCHEENSDSQASMDVLCITWHVIGVGKSMSRRVKEEEEEREREQGEKWRGMCFCEVTAGFQLFAVVSLSADDSMD